MRHRNSVILSTHIDNLLKQECGVNKNSVSWGVNELTHIFECLRNLLKIENDFMELQEENKKLSLEIQTYRDKEGNQKEVSEKVADS